jgi:hypothetical protein
VRILSSSNERSRWFIGVALVILAGLPPLAAAALGRFGARRFGFLPALAVLGIATVTAVGLSSLVVGGSLAWLQVSLAGAGIGCVSAGNGAVRPSPAAT